MVYSKKHFLIIVVVVIFVLGIFNNFNYNLEKNEDEIKSNEQLNKIEHFQEELGNDLKQESVDLDSSKINKNEFKDTTKISNEEDLILNGNDESYLKIDVLDVVDGDTVKVRINNKSETIRVIGINTPETVHPSKPVECFGVAASNQAKLLLSDKKITVVNDKSQGERDKYGRLLAYIIMPDGRDFGKVMIEGGFAYEYTYNVPYEKQTLYKETQAQASKKQVGLWAPSACDESKTEAAAPVITTVASVTDSVCNIKGNISSDGEKIYHMPNQQYYAKTIIDESSSERWFCSEIEAKMAGWRKALK